MYICIYIYIYTHAYVYTCVYIYIYISSPQGALRRHLAERLQRHHPAVPLDIQ